MSTAMTTCPVCGGLECLCRPRFFAGQLLTEEDLNRLDHYIVAHQRLHNRSLHGWGVVNGLDVHCDPCTKGSVTVGPGHALSPCGDDIVVCEDVSVDVCALIDACTPPDRDACHDFPAPDDADCDEADADWILCIRYEEVPTRGVVPLRGGGGGKAVSCGCGGGGGCRCGANGNGNGNGNGHRAVGVPAAAYGASALAAPRAVARALECEPTIVCERFRFCVRRVPVRTRKDEATGPAGRRFEACVEAIRDHVPEFPTEPTEQERYQWCCRARGGLLELLRSEPYYDCSLAARVSQIVCVSPEANGGDARDQAIEELMTILFELLMSCVCRALQPPAPDPVLDDCVPLATVHVRRRECTVLSVCNWTRHRKYVLAAPTLEYWFSVLGVSDVLQEFVERMCCGFEFRPRRERPSAVVNAVRTAALGATAWQRGGSGMAAASLVRAVVDRRDLPSGADERLLQFVLADQALRPFSAAVHRAAKGDAEEPDR